MLTNLIQNEIESIEKETGKKMLLIEEAADYVGMILDDFNGLVESGEIKCLNVGTNKYIKAMELAKFLREDDEINKMEKFERPIDFGLAQRYPSTIFIEDLGEEDYMEMERRGKGEGSVFFNEGRNVWQAAISLGKDENGKRLRKIISAKEKDDVLKAMKEFMTYSYPTINNTDTMSCQRGYKCNEVTLSDFLNNFMANIKGGPQSRTFASYIGVARHIEEGLGKLMLSEIDKDTCQRFINGFTEKVYKKGNTESRYSQSMIHKIYMLLKMVLKDAAEKELIKSNYMEYIKEPKAKKYVETKYKALSDDEIRTILAAVDDNPVLKTVTMIMNYTGMRPGEVYALRLSDIDFERKTISVKRALSFDREVDITSKKAIGRRIPIIKELKNERGGKVEYAKRTLTVGNSVIEVIKDWQKHLETMPELLEKRKENGIEDYLFSGTKGNLVTLDIHTQIYDRHLCKKSLSSSEFNLYRFRHTFCTRLLKMGKDPKTVMMIMGDNTLDMVLKVYNSINRDDIIRVSSEYADMMDCTLEMRVG